MSFKSKGIFMIKIEVILTFKNFLNRGSVIIGTFSSE